jgi:hypothetical protein
MNADLAPDDGRAKTERKRRLEPTPLRHLQFRSLSLMRPQIDHRGVRVPGHRRWVMLAMILFTVATVAETPVAQSQDGPEPQPQPAAKAIASLLSDHDLVAIGESHSLSEAGRFYRSLVRDRDFQAVVDDVVVEFGNARYQEVIDRYVRGRAVSRRALQAVWRDTTQPAAWDAPMYQQFFRTVRTVNRSLPPSQKLRIVLADPPIDWDKVDSFRDWDSFARRRERHFARVIRREVFERSRKAVMIAGLLHVRRGESETIDLLDRWRPGETFVVVTHLGFPNVEWERRLFDWESSSLAILEGTSIGDLPRGDGIASDTYDGLLYLGNPPFLRLSLPLPTLYRDDTYWATLKRRYELVFRRDFQPGAFFAYQNEARYPESGIDEREIAVLFKFSQCMRDEGVEAFPDPEAGFDFLGWTEEKIEVARNDPDYESAAETCSERSGLPFAI